MPARKLTKIYGGAYRFTLGPGFYGTVERDAQHRDWWGRIRRTDTGEKFQTIYGPWAAEECRTRSEAVDAVSETYAEEVRRGHIAK